MNPTETVSRPLRVAVLMGGTSSERAISLSTGRMILNALDPEKYLVTALDTQDLLTALTPTPPLLEGTASPSAPSEPSEASQGRGEKAHQQVGESYTGSLTPLQTREPEVRLRPDVVFIALHGKGGEDGTVQGMLEMLGLPYTGSGVLASALAMNKSMAKRLYHSAGIPVIPDVQVPRGHGLSDEALIRRVCAVLDHFPVFVKPNAEGSTVGCALVSTPEALPQAVAEALQYDPLALVERYIKGVEITVGVLGNTGDTLEPLPVIEIVPKSAYYDYESKYADGGSDHIIPARLPAPLLHQAQEIALRCHTLLGCRGMSRTDMLVEGEHLYVLETNTIPGMTPTSLLPQAAAHAGIPFAELLDRLIGSALAK